MEKNKIYNSRTAKRVRFISKVIVPLMVCILGTYFGYRIAIDLGLEWKAREMGDFTIGGCMMAGGLLGALAGAMLINFLLQVGAGEIKYTNGRWQYNDDKKKNKKK